MSGPDRIAGRVRDLLAQILDIPPASIGPGFAAASAATWTSLNHLMLVSQVESEFEVVFSNAEIRELTSFDRIVAAVSAHLEQ